VGGCVGRGVRVFRCLVVLCWVVLYGVTHESVFLPFMYVVAYVAIDPATTPLHPPPAQADWVSQDHLRPEVPFNTSDLAHYIEGTVRDPNMAVYDAWMDHSEVWGRVLAAGWRVCVHTHLHLNKRTLLYAAHVCMHA
jgi:hypothetical protein